MLSMACYYYNIILRKIHSLVTSCCCLLSMNEVIMSNTSDWHSFTIVKVILKGIVLLAVNEQVKMTLKHIDFSS